MQKPFLEVFPTLQLKESLQGLMKETWVEKITSNPERDYLHIYLHSEHLLMRYDLYQVEQTIKKQLFARAPVKIAIKECFHLSKQYTLKNLMEVYEPSLSWELEQKNRLRYQMFSTAKKTFEGEDTLILTLKDYLPYRQKEVQQPFIQDLQEMITQRCGVPMRVELAYEPANQAYQHQLDYQVEQHVRMIYENNYGHQKKTEQKEESSDNSKSFVKPVEVRPLTTSDDPAMIYGKDFNDNVMIIKEITGEIGDVVIRGEVISFETREIRNERTIVMFVVTDYTDSIGVKLFLKNENLPEICARIHKGAFIKLKGKPLVDAYTNELTISSLAGIKEIGDFKEVRQDHASIPRVELHCHTKMSDMDAVSDVQDIIKRAHDWGHPAIALTDHGVVQSFPEANHYIESLEKDDPFKVIYGVEGYLVDDLTDIIVNAKEYTLHDDFVVFDIETTGFSSIKDKVIEIGAIRIHKGKIVGRFSQFINPNVPIPYTITQLTGITDAMVMDAPPVETILQQFLEFAKEAVLVAHNASFDVGFIEQNMRYQDMEPDFTYLDTVALARLLLPQLNKYKLDVVAKELKVSLENHHRAIDDATATAEIFLKLRTMLLEDANHIHNGEPVITLKEVNQLKTMDAKGIRKLPTYHVILLAQTDEGRVNLYKLVSMSHLTYFGRRPRIPKSELLRYRRGILVGSACEAGEIYQGLLQNKSPEKMAKLIELYDYLEVQPLGNNAFMVDSEKVTSVTSYEDLKEYNRQIIRLGEKFKKPVVATCDVHFLDPDAEVYRRIIMAGKGFKDADQQPPLYLRTTEEMLNEFSYLGSQKAYEIVVENPRKIAATVEKISPVRPDKCPPVIEDSDQKLRQICYDKAHSMYGEELPEVVVERLERELHSIISNGFAVMYIIAQKLVWKSNDDGYLVGSRGSVGSSFVATMAGITEVNPLSPHYYCKHCHYSEFDSPEVKKYAGGCGWDMPDKACPNCGEMLVKDGFDIPFETFLGFKGNKEPDIDLNFSGDYQSNAHKYTEIIFGDGQTFRAGTIGTLAEKTAFGYVKKYYEEREDRKRNCEIDRIVGGCTGIRRSTGQHPGGIIVLPIGEEINSFTPVQHPANDMTTDIITTHFDYHSIDHNLLKLDILGHDDPTIIKMLEELVEQMTGKPFDAKKIPLDDKDVMALFAGTEVLKIKPEDIGGCPVGCLGIPEFGTDFVVQMVVDTKPKTLSDLIRISGLSHGTDVWLGNAQTLIEEGKATISTAICTRDDIMTYLINQGMDSELSFTIMEKVRKGKGLTPEFEAAMKEAGVPDWYIWSCKKIKYMFPKAHAAAYVMMAYRIAYCKVNYPLAYYAAFFSIRATSFSYELMCQGLDTLRYFMNDYKKRSDSLTNKEELTLKDMKIVEEMYARGFEFVPIDLYRAKSNKFQIVDGKLMPSLSTIDGLGEKAADAVEVAAKQGPFLSRDDFRQRTKVSKTVIEKMAELGLFGDLPESNQLSLFDF